jgi:hypothetical protein
MLYDLLLHYFLGRHLPMYVDYCYRFDYSFKYCKYDRKNVV